MNIIGTIFRRLLEHLNIARDKESEQAVIDNVRRAVEFRGVNLWILIFAVIIASIGLNIDSTPIIIGAMLISPLMGPIIGAGLAVGINDMELMKRSIRNLFVAALFAVVAATMYFLISPLNEAQSELLARTSPTLYDVFIAFIGGVAGFLALSTTGNHIQVIIGVAISTALMPPLCTVGFGVATGNWLYALGAFYLFFINSVFIAIATFISVRFFKFSQKNFTDKDYERKVRRTLIALSILTLCPSLFLTYNIVRKTIYLQNADRFVAQELNFPGTQIIDKQINYNAKTIQTVFIGNYIPKMLIESVEKRLPEYHLENTKLSILQDGFSRDSVMLTSLRGDIVQDLYQKNEIYTQFLQRKIDSLENYITVINHYKRLDSLVFNESRALFPHINSISLGYLWENSENGDSAYTFARVSSSNGFNENEHKRFSEWLRLRVEEPKMQIEFLGN